MLEGSPVKVKLQHENERSFPDDEKVGFVYHTRVSSVFLAALFVTLQFQNYSIS